MNTADYIIWFIVSAGAIYLSLYMIDLRDDKQTLLSVTSQMNEEIAIRDSKIEDLCTAIDLDKDNFRVSCEDIKGANDYGRGEGRTR